MAIPCRESAKQARSFAVSLARRALSSIKERAGPVEEQGPLGPVYAIEVERLLELLLLADALEGFLIALHVHEATR
jgi:hypothetical protein